MRTYSIQQEAVRDAVKRGQSVASPTCAGAGKTSTARPLVLERMSAGVPGMSTPFMNTLYMEELAALPGADVLNAHKRGCRMLGKWELENSKVLKIAEQVCPKEAAPVAELVGKLKSEAYGIGGKKSVEEVAQHYGLKGGELIDKALEVLSISDRRRDVVDFDDMIRFPVLSRAARPHNGLLLIDEAQDYSRALLEFIKLFIGPKTQGLILGDPANQALQQFAGADPTCFHDLASLLNAEVIPLTYNFRCARKIVENCNAYVPSAMEAAPNAIEGEVGTATMEDLNGLDETSAILCQMNSPLLSFVVSQIEQDKPVQFRPGKLWEKCRGQMWGAFDTRKVPVGTIADKLEAQAREHSEEDGASLQDKLEWIRCIGILENLCLARGVTKPAWEGRKPIHPIEQVIRDLAKGKTGPFAMTGHTAKGLQWRTVYHINREPAKPKNREPLEWETHQWRCVGYVIRTRAMERHFTINA